MKKMPQFPKAYGWLQIAFWVGSFLLSKLLQSKPDVENARPAGQEDFTLPTATEGRSIPHLWGTAKVTGNVIWFGGLRQLPVEEDDQIIAWNYYLGIQFALCRGEVDAIENIIINDKIASGGRTGSGALNIDAPSVLGGTSYGTGGVVGNGNFYAGSTTEVVNTYLSAFQSPQAAHRRTCTFVYEGGWVGQSSQLAGWAFRLRRINDADGLGLAVSNPGKERVNNTDANCMNVIYELMTDTYWGLKISPGLIDVPNFTAAAVTLADEGNGFSFLQNDDITADELLAELERQIDGKVFLNRALGLYQVKLARDDYTPASLPVFNADNCELIDFTRKDWPETINHVTVKFQDIEDNFKETYAIAMDGANIQIQGEIISQELHFPGVKNRTLANKLAWRELVPLAYPLAKARFTVNRDAYNLNPLDVIKFSWTDSTTNIPEIVLRITDIDYGDLDDEVITIYASEDVFADGVPAFADPSVTSWGDPNADPIALTAANTLVFEAGRQWVVQAKENAGQNPRWWCGGRDPGGGTAGFQIYYRYGTSRPLAGAYNPDGLIPNFIPVGELDANVADYGASATRPATDYDIVVNNNLDSITGLITSPEEETSNDTVNALQTIVYINGEFIGYEFAEVVSGKLELKNLHRGLFNSAPKAHSAGDRVWFIGKSYRASGSGGWDFGFRDTKPNSGELMFAVIADETQDEIDIQLRAQSKTETLSEGATLIEEKSLQKMWKAPLPPRDPILNDTYADVSVDLDTQYTTETGLTGDDARALKVEATERSWREDTVTEDATLPADYTDDSPFFDVVLTLDPDGTPVVVDTVSVADTCEAYVLRNSIIKAVGANASIPTTARLAITARHTPDDITPSVEITSPVDMEFDMTTVTSSLQSEDLFFGGFAVNTPSASVVFGETGNYTFDIHTALPASGVLQASINGGGFSTVIAAGLTTGVLAVTSSDSIRLQFTQAPTTDQFFDVTGPTSETGHGVLEA